MSPLITQRLKRYLILGFLVAPLTSMAQKTVIKADPTTSLRPINPGIYGVNQRWFDYDLSLWKDENSKLHKNYKEVGLGSFRYPAGTAAGAFDWKGAIGPKEKRKVIEGHTWIGRKGAAGGDNGGGGGTMSVDFGLDEALQFCEKTGSTFIYMYNFGTGSAADAADLVEYLNAPVGANPNDGIAWAQERAKNGHPKPYNVKYIEMGNEMYILGQQHYWLEGKSKHDHAYKYCFGDTVAYTKQLVGDLDAHSLKAATSSPTSNLVKYIRYRPVLPNSANVYVGETCWKRVNDLKTAGVENVYTLDEATGKITFGDGRHGNLPLQNDSAAVITASYQAARDGFDDHYRAIKSVDPNIKVLSCLIDMDFIRHMGAKSPYDGVAIHPYAGFWNLPKKESVDNYHDLVLLNSDEEADSARHTLDIMRKYVGPTQKDKVQVIFTEYGIALGTIAPQYQSSIDQALYTGRIVSAAIELGMPLTSKHSITSVIGSAPHFVITPTGYLFKLYSRMFGTTHIPASVDNNPVRKAINGKELPKLHVTSSKDKAGNVYLMVMNRDRADAVTADVELNKYTLTNRAAIVWTLSAPEYTAYNTPENPDTVSIKESVDNAKGNVLTHTFPAHSITAIKLTGKVK